VERAKYSRRRRRRRGRGRGSYPAQLRCLAGGGNTEASGELRELFGSWTAILLIFPLFLFCSFSFSLSLLLSRGIVEILRSLIFLQGFFFSSKICVLWLNWFVGE
jgi:hypothetical protein